MNTAAKPKIAIHIIFILMCITFIIPIMYVITISISTEQAIEQYGYQLFPNVVSLDAYRYVFKSSGGILDAYYVTIFMSAAGSVLSLAVMSLVAYPLSSRYFHFKKSITFYIFFTMLFSGGLIPGYILNTQYLGLSNNIWVYILPSLANAWHIVMLRTFFGQLPSGLVESAKIDGANELKIFYSIILPLSKPVLATVLFMTLLTKWNDWYTTLIFIRNPKLYTLQYLLQRVLREVEFVKNLSLTSPGLNVNIGEGIPAEPMRFAMVVIAAGPMLAVFPFFQKYFTRGLTVGAIKG